MPTTKDESVTIALTVSQAREASEACKIAAKAKLEDAASMVISGGRDGITVRDRMNEAERLLDAAQALSIFAMRLNDRRIAEEMAEKFMAEAGVSK